MTTMNPLEIAASAWERMHGFDKHGAAAFMREQIAAQAASGTPPIESFAIRALATLAPSEFVGKEVYWNAVQQRIGVPLSGAALAARRLPVTAGDWEQRPDELIDASAYLLSPKDEEESLDPWREIDGIDRHGRTDHVSLVFASNGKTATVHRDSLVYVSAKNHFALVEAARRRESDE